MSNIHLFESFNLIKYFIEIHVLKQQIKGKYKISHDLFNLLFLYRNVNKVKVLSA